MGSFLLCGDEQLHDLHSKLRLEHPRGTANQLHKCAAPFPLQPFCTANCSITTTFIIDMYPSGRSNPSATLQLRSMVCHAIRGRRMDFLEKTVPEKFGVLLMETLTLYLHRNCLKYV